MMLEKETTQNKLSHNSNLTLLLTDAIMTITFSFGRLLAMIIPKCLLTVVQIDILLNVAK